ncbi:endolytic transglycosylase MltG [Gellertiella hungarica]|uniref:Endolytic murein transglycosylase n=1 Tax=Gellertiella hungarica TaxID=1572859 RepID=A0A7W6J7Z1_9HYPH|nr:UPF0755 protein [Gellertiella hungarica]
MSDSDHTNDQPAARETPAQATGGSPIIPKSANEALKPERVPMPPMRSKRARSQIVIFFNFLMTLAVIGTVALAGIAYYALSAFNAPGPLETNTTFQVREKLGLGEIANGLERNNIISDARIFRAIAPTYLKGETLKAGEYEIKAGSSMKDVMELLRSGKSILYSISFPEGLTVKQMFNRMMADPILEGELPAEVPPEGSLRPDTYKFSRGTTRMDIINQARAAQQKLVDEIWERRDASLPLENKQQFVTLASIVERETGKADERPRVASVFINRLKKGMRLQSDPTIVYGIFGGEGKPADRPIYQSDLKKDTPYNTYIIKGLPPGPIASPGKAALEAVANPSRTDDLYFVADGTGGHVFASTLEEHNVNVKRWRKLEAAKGAGEEIAVDGQPADEAAPEAEEAKPSKKKKKSN